MGRPRKVRTPEEQREYDARRKEQYRLSKQRRRQNPSNQEAERRARVKEADRKRRARLSCHERRQAENEAKRRKYHADKRLYTALVISNIYSVAEQSPAVAAAESEAPIVPELWPSEQSVSDGPEKKKIKQEPNYDEDVSWDTNDSVDDRVDGESLSSNQAQAQQHRAEATLENTADTSMASTSASPTAGSQQDAFHFFGMMVADRLRRLPRGAALRALNAMHQVLFQHEEEAGF
ncbi:uncharacterized protein [Dermacentor andersoni]|uniref:uncharacterized protein isoform X6 n=1 Tax=Dermacentor andersoni TaxID=34620 RepID=UPI002415BAF0|nr:uncharacterized protein LOC126533695 isoform X7 [Dermacentor andersoni]